MKRPSILAALLLASLATTTPASAQGPCPDIPSDYIIDDAVGCATGTGPWLRERGEEVEAQVQQRVNWVRERVEDAGRDAEEAVGWARETGEGAAGTVLGGGAAMYQEGKRRAEIVYDGARGVADPAPYYTTVRTILQPWPPYAWLAQQQRALEADYRAAWSGVGTQYESAHRTADLNVRSAWIVGAGAFNNAMDGTVCLHTQEYCPKLPADAGGLRPGSNFPSPVDIPNLPSEGPGTGFFANMPDPFPVRLPEDLPLP